jgi:hypothetical protein
MLLALGMTSSYARWERTATSVRPSPNIFDLSRVSAYNSYGRSLEASQLVLSIRIRGL